MFNNGSTNGLVFGKWGPKIFENTGFPKTGRTALSNKKALPKETKAKREVMTTCENG